MTTIYVGNIPYNATQEELHSFFEAFGKVKRCSLVMFEGRPKGFGFVEFASKKAFTEAMEHNDCEFMGRKLKITQAKQDSSNKYSDKKPSNK